MAERWKPKYNDKYFLVICDGKVESAYWEDYEFDQRCFAIGNCFKSKAEAQAAAEKVKTLLLGLHNEQDSIQDMVTNTCQAMDKGKENVAKATCTFGNLPKLTAEVFNRPDCPEWAKWAAVVDCGNGVYFDTKPRLGNISNPWSGFKKWSFIYSPTGEVIQWDASDWQNSIVERPSAKLPDWVEVGGYVYDDRNGYGKIVSGSVKSCYIEFDGGAGDFVPEAFSELKPARLRPYNADEIRELVGEVLKTADGDMQLITSFYKSTVRVVVGGLVDRPASEILEIYTHLDGSPCGCLEHLENGEWVK